MLRKLPPLALVMGFALLLLAEPACTARKLPGLRKPRDPGKRERAEQPRVEQDNPSYDEDNSVEPYVENEEGPAWVETALPGETVALLAEPRPMSYDFVPSPQPTAMAASLDTETAGAGKHPRLYFSAGELKKMQAKASTSHRDIAARIFAYGDKNSKQKNSLPPSSQGSMPKSNGGWRKYGDRLMGMAAAYALQTNPSKKQAYGDWCVEAMRRLSSFKDWGPSHEYAVGLDGAHILFGFSVAYDLVYDELNAAEQDKFAERIRKQALLFYGETQKRDSEFWTTSYTNNHNYINHNALLNAALVVEDRYREARDWIAQVKSNTQLVMDLRAEVVDGSTNEGIMYGTYGSHALFATLDLLEEHRLADHLDNPWLTQHFNFLLHGSVSGFARVLGLADNHGTFGHGPQHLLYFLDRVTEDGRPSWVAEKVTQVLGRKNPYGKPEGSTLLFEYLWFDEGIKPKPVSGNTDGFHYFEDWGVVTFRRGWGANDTFFGFKSGDPAGEAMWDLMLKGDPRVSNTNVSHSHPDAGGFTFAPGGKNFISANLYPKPKRSALSSTYTFTPSFAIAPPIPQKAIERMWDPKKIDQVGRLDEVGQVGEWGQWMGPIKMLIKARPNADVIHAYHENGAVFVSGEIADAYPKQAKQRSGGNGNVGIERVYRNMLLLPEDVLVIVDHVETRGNVTPHAYFRSISSPNHKASWAGKGSIATLQGGEASGGQVEAVFPAGMQIETGREIFSYEDAKGDNRRGVKDWNSIAHTSVFARFSNPKHNGVQTYVYVLRPNGQMGKVTDVQVGDKRGVGFKVETDRRNYAVRIAFDLAKDRRKAFLGFDGYVKLDYSPK